MRHTGEMFQELSKTKAHPVFANKRKTLTEKQAEKANVIIQSMYDDFSAKTWQKRESKKDTYRATSYRTQLVDHVKDVCYGNQACLSFDFYSVGLEIGVPTPVLRLEVPQVYGYIQFVGLDDLEEPSDILNNYGYFVPSYNQNEGEYQLSFIAAYGVPEKIWKVSLSFIVGESNG